MRRAMVLLLCVVLLGCASRRLAAQLDAGIGYLTATDAIATYGPPVYVQPVPDGLLMAWERGNVSSTSFSPVIPISDGAGGYRLAPLPVSRTILQDDRSYLMLRFDLQDRLMSWRQIAR